MTDQYDFLRDDLTRNTFANVVTAIAHFNADNYTGEPSITKVPTEYVENVSYVVACFFAQRYNDGVETLEPADALRMDEFMSWDERRELVVKWMDEFEDRA